MEFTLLGAALLAAAAAAAVLWWDWRRDRDPATRHLGDLLLTSVIVGLAVGRIAAMVAGGTNPLTHPGDILIVRGGVATGPAAVAALLAAGFGARRDLWRTLDAAAPAALAGLGGWHVGCLPTGSCAGTATGLPWGITVGGEIARHPVELYAALLLAAGVAALLYLRRYGPPQGVLVGAALAWAGIVRLATEPLRLGLGTDPGPWYAAGIAAGLGVVLGSVVRSRQAQP
jgi:prolipoprotein diacylglyceryltransferase